MISYTFNVDATDRSALLPFGLSKLADLLSRVGEQFAGKAMEAYGRESSALMSGRITESVYVARVMKIRQSIVDEIRRQADPRVRGTVRLKDTDPRVRGTVRLKDAARPAGGASPMALPEWMRQQGITGA